MTDKEQRKVGKGRKRAKKGSIKGCLRAAKKNKGLKKIVRANRVDKGLERAKRTSKKGLIMEW